MKFVSADEVRAAIAALVLGDRHAATELGAVTLHPHQREGLERVVQLLAQHGGALLADDVGLGKTFVALAAARDARNPVVVAPAALRDVWSAAARDAGVAVRFLSVEMLGRRGKLACESDFVVIDEAHHLRSAVTRRFAAASALCSGAKVLLMSATPVQNRLADLRTILSLFLGERAHAMSEDDLARFIVRRIESDVQSPTFALPQVRAPRWVRPVDDVDCLDRLLALPPPLPPADGEDGGVLLTYTLARQWASSRAALRAALERRLARARAMEDALVAGRLPSRAELAAWCYADGAQQLTFPELFVRTEAPDAAAFLAQVRHHACGVRALLGWLETSVDPDRARAASLRELVDSHAGERIIAFSQYADTVRSLYRSLAPTIRSAMLTHGGGRVAGGPLTRGELLRRFAPGATARASESDRIDLLLTTDVLSEGVNLQEASVVVHLDLSWNPARLEQRVGRLRRAGAARDAIAVYMFAPPAPTERLLQLERRLRGKLDVAARSIGVAGVILPGLSTADVRDASAAREERIIAALRRWSRGDRRAPGDVPLCAAVESSCDAAIACVPFGGEVVVVAISDGSVTDSRAVVEELLGCAGGAEAALSVSDARAAKERIESWLRRRIVSDVVDLPALRIARSRRVLLHRVDTIARRVPRHAQPLLAPLMRAARTAAMATLSAGAERVLEELAHAPMQDEAWLHAVGEFASLHAQRETDAPEVLALLVLRSR
jgi:superfamily II DNA or RNA helicase